MTEKKQKCVWNMGYDCSGEITEETIFNGQIAVPICEAHLKDHKQMLFLHAHGEDVEEILQLSPEDREKLFNKIKAKFPDDEVEQ
jgi:hypothetical protein